jgi:hypothetical protein
MSNPGVKTEESITDPHKAFRGIMMLLTLVTAINNGGHLVLPRETDSEDGTTSDQTKGDDLLNAITAIIMRNHEIVAAFAHSLKLHIVLQEGMEVANISGITTLINPRKKDKGLSQKPVLANAGSSHLEDILQGDFKFLIK